MSNFGKFPLLPVWTKIISHHSVTELHGTINLLRETQQRLHKKKIFPLLVLESDRGRGKGKSFVYTT